MIANLIRVEPIKLLLVFVTFNKKKIIVVVFIFAFLMDSTIIIDQRYSEKGYSIN